MARTTGLGQQRQLAPVADIGARGHGIMAAPLDLAADLAIDQRRRENGGPAVQGKPRHALAGALVKRIGLGQQARDHAPQGLRRLGRGQEGFGVDARPRASQSQRQVEPSGARVLADVARDVGELHGDAEVAGPRQRVGVAHAA